MKKNTTTIIILLAAAGLGYYLWTKRRKTATSIAQQAGSVAGTAAATAAGQVLSGAGGGTSGTTSGSGTGTTSGKINFTDAEQNKLLSKGQSGNQVKALQLYLQKAGENIGASGADGIFGTNTEDALYLYEGKKTITLADLRITAVNINSQLVYGEKSGWLGEGIWNGTDFV